MEYNFSKHALEQMELRKISEDTVKKIMDKPEQIIEQNGKKIYQSIIKTGSQEYLLRVFVNDVTKPNTIITVYKTSNIKKYYESKI